MVTTELAPTPAPYATDIQGYRVFDGAYAIITWTTSWGGQASKVIGFEWVGDE